MKKSEKDFIMDRYDELIEKVVKAEVRRKQAEDEVDFLRKSLASILQRPVALSLTDEQVDRIIRGIGPFIAQAVASQIGEVN